MHPRAWLLRLVLLGLAVHAAACSSTPLSGLKKDADAKDESASKGEEKAGAGSLETEPVDDASAPPDPPEWMPLRGFECALEGTPTVLAATVACEVKGASPPDDVRKRLTSAWRVTGNETRESAKTSSEGLWKVRVTSPAADFDGRTITLSLFLDNGVIYRKTKAFLAIPIGGPGPAAPDPGAAPAAIPVVQPVADHLAGVSALFYAKSASAGLMLITSSPTEGDDEGKTASTPFLKAKPPSYLGCGHPELVEINRRSLHRGTAGHTFDYDVTANQTGLEGWDFDGPVFCLAKTAFPGAVALRKWIDETNGLRHYTTKPGESVPGFKDYGVIGYAMEP